jgi:transmembrane sensor
MRNETDQSEMDILLAAYFAGEADSMERAQVEAWINASEENRKYFESSQKIWNAAGQLVADKTFNTDAAWKKLKAEIDAQSSRTAPVKRNYSWTAAAGVILLVGIASLLWFMRDGENTIQTMTVASAAEVINDTLPDGSLISLNKNSQLSYPSSFNGEQREVTLNGEAFFDVSHDAEHPFVIHTEMMDVKVLGTSFNVRAYPGGDSVHVSVNTGKVQCMAGRDTVIIMPGEYAVYTKGNRSIRKGQEDNPNRSAYRDRIFRFNNTSLGVAVQQLNDAYGCNIVLENEALKTCTFTITKVFNNEPVGNIIEAIEVIFPEITSHQEGNTITLDGPACK